MTIRTILACLTTETAAPNLSAAGAALAARFDAHLIGQHTIEALMVYPGIAMHVPPPAFEAFNSGQLAQADAIEAIFQEVTRRDAIRGEWRLVKTESITAADRMIESARSCDLVLMSRPDREHDRTDQRHAVQVVIRGAGRPVLLVPPGGIGDGVGKRAIVAHSGTREAARATFDLLPLLADGADVHVVHIGDERDELRDDAMTELSAALARHGYSVTLTHRVPHGDPVAAVLAREAAEIGADVIAAGAFGHSRAYDLFFGAVTESLIRDADVPVLFST